jgi:hypothetical protein
MLIRHPVTDVCIGDCVKCHSVSISQCFLHCLVNTQEQARHVSQCAPIVKSRIIQSQIIPSMYCWETLKNHRHSVPSGKPLDVLAMGACPARSLFMATFDGPIYSHLYISYESIEASNFKRN